MATKRKARFLPKGKVTIRQVLAKDEIREAFDKALKDIPDMKTAILIWETNTEGLQWITAAATLEHTLGLLEWVKLAELHDAQGVD